MVQGINSKKENVASILEFDIGCKHHIAHVLETRWGDCQKGFEDVSQDVHMWFVVPHLTGQ
jgi:hypothetical protein